jgi:cytidylate kinase
MSYPVVCISSEDGAGAPETARVVAEALGFRLIDEEIVARTAAEAGVDAATVHDVERRKSVVARILEGLGSGGVATAQVLVWAPDAGYGERLNDDIRGLIRSVIEETASAGKAVIIAHAASHALAEREDVLRVHLTASVATRERRIAADLAIGANEAARAIKSSDAGRADYLKRFYGVRDERPTHYDLVINTDKLAPADAARLIVDAAGIPG